MFSVNLPDDFGKPPEWPGWPDPEAAYRAGYAAAVAQAVAVCRERAADLKQSVTLSIVGDMFSVATAEAEGCADAIAALKPPGGGGGV